MEAQAGSLSKKECSYRYWVDNDPLHKDAPKKEYKPQAVRPDQELPQVPLNKQTSAWNSKGTWEHRTLNTHDLLAHLKTNLDGKGVFTDTLDFEVLEVESAEGECSVVTVRGKQRLGYELKVVVRLQGVGTNIDKEGTLTVGISDDGDRDYHKAESEHDDFQVLLRNRVSTVGDCLSKVLKTMFQ